jgi:hypothetical protein
MAEYTDFGFMRPEDEDGKKPTVFWRNKQEPSFGQKAAQFFPNLIDKIRQNRMNKLYQQGEQIQGINKSNSDIEVSLPKSFNKDYLQYMKEPGFVERLGREMNGPSYRYGSNPQKDAEIQSRYNEMIGNVKGTRSSIINRGFTGEGGHYDQQGKIVFADSGMAQRTPVKFHEYSHAMVPLSQEKYGREFYEMIPGSEPNVAKQKMVEQQAKLSQIRGLVSQNMELAGIKPAVSQGADEDYYVRRALQDPEKYGSFINNEQLLKYYNALPENKRSVQYNSQEYQGAKDSMKKYSGEMRESYLEMPTEVRARTTSLRKALIDQGMPQSKQYTKDNVEKAIKGGKVNDFDSFKELKESGLSEDQIIYLLNNLAKAPQRQSQFQTMQRMA